MIYEVSYDAEEVWHHHSRDNNAKKKKSAWNEVTYMD